MTPPLEGRSSRLNNSMEKSSVGFASLSAVPAEIALVIYLPHRDSRIPRGRKRGDICLALSPGMPTWPNAKEFLRTSGMHDGCFCDTRYSMFVSNRAKYFAIKAEWESASDIYNREDVAEVSIKLTLILILSANCYSRRGTASTLIADALTVLNHSLWFSQTVRKQIRKRKARHSRDPMSMLIVMHKSC